jgi:DNA-binding GntR family transcriptional regulator
MPDSRLTPGDFTPLTEAPALRSQVYDRLREAILSGELAPGERISPAEVGRGFGVSAMPVRDALRLLEQDGLVEMASRRWTRVVELSLEQAQELVPLVALLEQYAVSNATAAGDENLERLRSANEAFRRAIDDSDAAALVRADAEFHDTLVELAANASLVRALRDARTRIRLFRPQVVRPELAADSVSDHQRIIACLEAGDFSGAADAVGENWRRSLDRFRITVQVTT